MAVGKIGTHNGQFHCDEAFACYMLKRMQQYKNYEIVRSRDPAVLNTCDIVVDVGGVYDHEKKKYDHHQKEFVQNMQSLEILPFSTKLSSAGLVYAHYGKQIISEIIGNNDEKLLNMFYHKIYESFVEAIDAVDNGIPQYDGVPRYRSSGGISGRVGHLNPHWNEQDVNPDERFQAAMKLVGEEFEHSVNYLWKVWWPARDLVEKSIDKRFEVSPGGRVVKMEGGVPWKEHFFTLEEEKGLQNQKITYTIYEDTTNGGWRIQAIPTNRMSTFDNRMPLPAAWRGLRDDVLSEASGIPGGVFVHTGGFIGGNLTEKGALAMALKAIEIGDALVSQTQGTQPEPKKSKNVDG